MRKILILTLIILPLSMLSQEVIIKGEKTILSKDKTIDVAKIIKNEARLQKRVAELEQQLVSLNDSIQSTAKRHQKALETIDRLSNVVSQQYERINELTEQDLAIEKRKSNFGVYSFINAGSDLDGFRTFDFGFQLVRSKTFYSLSVDPIFADKPIFKIGVGFKVF